MSMLVIMQGWIRWTVVGIILATQVAFTQETKPEVKAPTIRIETGSQVFEKGAAVRLSSNIAEAKIYFTTDGSVPSKDHGELYESRILITKSTHLMAIAIAPDGETSDIGIANYLKVADDFPKSSLPIMVIDTLGNGAIPGKGWNQTGEGITQVPRKPAIWMLFDIEDPDSEDENYARVEGVPHLATRIGIRQRGSFSSSWKEKPYSVEAWDGEDEETKVSPLGMPKHSDWTLYYPDPGPMKDRTLIYNTFMWALSAKAGRYAPRFRWVEAYVNEDGGALQASDRRGLYAIVEKVSRGKNRLAFSKLSDNGKTGGWQLSINRMDAAYYGGWPAPNGISQPQYFHTAGPDRTMDTPPNQPGRGDDFPTLNRANFNFENPGGYKIKPIQRIAIESWLHQFEDVLYDDARWLDPEEGYQKYIDSADFADFFIFNNLAQNFDGLLLSIYPWRSSEDGLLRMGPTWDFNFGCYNQSGSPTGNAMNQSDRLWYGRLFEDPAFMQLYAERWQTLRKDALSNASISEVIASQVNEIGEATATAQGIAPEGQWKQRLNTMETWLHKRADWLDGQFPKPPAISVANGATVSANTTVRISASKGTVYYTVDGSDPRDGSKPSDTATVVHPPKALPLLKSKAPARALVPLNTKVDTTWFDPEFDDSGWQLGTTGVGYDEDRTYRRLIGLDLEDKLAGSRTTVYVRVPFEIIGDPTSYRSLALHMAYDDGFAAYLNGTQVATDRAPNQLGWKSRATSKNNDRVGFNPATFELDQFLPLLRKGTNVLAIHSLNDQPSSSDMLVAPTLSVGVRRDSQAEGPVITKETTITARTFFNDLWSSPVRATLTVQE